MSRRTMETAVGRLERRQKPCRQRYIVWFCGKPWGELPAERDPDIQYFHLACDTPDWREQWERIPVKNRQSAGQDAQNGLNRESTP